MGGPLLHADIEDLAEFGPTIICPWHRYQISLRTGDGLYQNMQRQTCSKGLRQRVHEVQLRGGYIAVRLSAGAGAEKAESDTYAFKPPPPSGGGAQQPPPGRSGDVLRAGAAGKRSCGGALPAGGPGGAPLPPSVATDVARSMAGADGRAPWARAGGPPLPPRLPPSAARPGDAGSAPSASSAGAASVGPSVGGMVGGVFQQLGQQLFGQCQPQQTGDARSDWVRVTVARSRPVGRRTVQLTIRGALPGTDASVWRRGSHVMVMLPPHAAVPDSGAVERPYTPYVLPGSSGAFELVVKAYDGGAVSPHLAGLGPGAPVLVRGPLGGVAPSAWDGAAAFGLLAGGTGITPMLQLIYGLIHEAGPAGQIPPVRLLCFHRAEADVLLRAELDELAARHAALEVYYSLSDPPAGWKHGVGHPSAEGLRTRLPAPTDAGGRVRIFICGPPAFNDAVLGLCGDLGYAERQVHVYQ